MSAPYEPTSHEAFSHDSIDSLAYDWERVGSPDIAPKRPFQVFFPETTAEVVAAVKSLVSQGKSFKIRSKGHSSNDLVLEDRGHIICMQHMTAIKGFSADDGTVTVHSGAVLADVDDFLAKRGWGLPIIGDHNHITAGGFAAVGGISPASHRHGMFLDNVVELEYVTLEGEVRRVGAARDRDEFYAVLGSTGQLGVITELVLRVIRVDKYATILQNDRTLTRNVDDYVKRTAEVIQHPGDEVIMERGVWLDLPVAGREVTIGQFSAYSATPQSPIAKLGDRLAYGYLHGLGNIAGRLPTAIDEAVKYLGMAGIIVSPKFAR
jgi:FAD/FMN-containing dehydrogenase